VTIVGVLSREMMMLVPLVAFFHRRLLPRERLGIVGVVMAAAVTAYIAAHRGTIPRVLIGRAILRHRDALSSGRLLALLLIVQLVSERVFWGIPDPTSAVTAFKDLPTLGTRVYSFLDRLFVIDDFHWNLWSNFGSRPFHLLLLALYAAISAIVIVWMRACASRQQMISADSAWR
jgi:hypothetical protein